MHRAPSELGPDHDRDVVRIGAGLEPEGAADILGDDVQALLRPAHEAENVVAQRAGALRAGTHRVAVGGLVVACGKAARLHRGDDEALVDDRDARHVRGAADDLLDRGCVGVGIRRRARPVDRDIAGRFRPQLRRVRLDRVAHVDDRLDVLVFDDDALGGVLRGKRGLGDHDGNRLTNMHDAIARECRAVGHDELLAAAPREWRVAPDIADARRVHVRGSQDRYHAARALGLGDVDPHEAGAGMRRAHKGRIDLAELRRIGDEAAGAAHQIVVLDAWATAGTIDGSLCIHVEFRGFWGGLEGWVIAKKALTARRFDVHPAMQWPEMQCDICDR